MLCPKERYIHLKNVFRPTRTELLDNPYEAHGKKRSYWK